MSSLVNASTWRRLVCWLLPLWCASCETLPLLAPNDSTIVVVASRAELAIGDAEGTVITARVTEPGGTPVPNGTIVTFSTTLGSFDRQEASTDDGLASVRLRAGQLAGTAQVRAFSGTAESNAISIQIGGSRRTIVLSANPPLIPLNTSAEITATVAEPSGAPVRDGIVVAFSTTLGTLVPRTADTLNGRAIVTLQGGITPGVAQVTASSGDVNADPITVQIGTPASSQRVH